MKRIISFLFLGLSFIVARSQETKFTTALFRMGDDLSWSDVKLDESQWETVSINGNDHFDGIKTENSYAWYRIHFKMDSKPEKGSLLFLRLGYIDDADETYLNGHLIGTVKECQKPRIYSVDPDILNASGDNVIAIRVRNDIAEGGIMAAYVGLVPNEKCLDVVKDPGAYISSLFEEMAAAARKSSRSISNFAHYSRYADANAQSGDPKAGEHRVVLMGDSITDGWPRHRPEFFSTNDIIGRGISGETSYQFLLRFQNDVIDLHPTLVVINYGTNDIAENTGKYNEDQTFRNVCAMCEMARGAGIKVVLASTLPHHGFRWNPSITDAMSKVRSLNARVRKYAENEGFTYVDYFSSMVSSDGTRMREELSEDGVHPNPDGYQIMENLVLPVIQQQR